MAHDLDGFEVSYTSRTSWKAYISDDGKVLATAPVTWTKGTRRQGQEWFQRVWFQKNDEAEKHDASKEPFIVLVAQAHDYEVHPHAFKHFNCIYEVVALGQGVKEQSIECKVIRRIRYGDI